MSDGENSDACRVVRKREREFHIVIDDILVMSMLAASLTLRHLAISYYAIIQLISL